MGKLMGKEYGIGVSGTWNEVAKGVRATREAIKSTQPTSAFSSEDVESEDRVLGRIYLVPQKGESFKKYKDRSLQANAGKLVSLVSGKVPFNFKKSRIESKLKVNSVVREKEYQVTISASGDYAERGESIDTRIRDSLKQDAVHYTYNPLSKLI